MSVARPTIKQLLEHGTSTDQMVIGGLIRFYRHQGKKTSFLCLSDGTCFADLQCVCFSKQLTPEEWEVVQAITIGSAVELEGKLVESPKSGQKYELVVSKITLTGGCDSEQYPLIKQNFNLEHFRKHLHLRGRTPVGASVARIRSGLSLATHQFFTSQDFIYLHTPLITGSDCEGAGETFQVSSDARDQIDSNGKVIKREFFGKPAFLTVSGQLNGEAYACGMSRIYTFGPTFRADNSNTTRHLAEFWMIEPEVAFCDLFGIMDLAEQYVQYCVRWVLKNYHDDLVFFDQHAPGLLEQLHKLVAEPFIRLSYEEAIGQLQQVDSQIFEVQVEWGIDLGSEHEKYLVDVIHQGRPVILYNYPSLIKSFYMKENTDSPADRRTVSAMDLLVPGIGELIGGSQRETSLEILRRKMVSNGLKESEYREYLEIRKFGNMPHSGFGLGFERLVMLVTGLKNIRDVIPFPRHVGHLSF